MTAKPTTASIRGDHRPAPAYARVLDELEPEAWHVVEQRANNPQQRPMNPAPPTVIGELSRI